MKMRIIILSIGFISLLTSAPLPIYSQKENEGSIDDQETIHDSVPKHQVGIGTNGYIFFSSRIPHASPIHIQISFKRNFRKITLRSGLCFGKSGPPNLFGYFGSSQFFRLDFGLETPQRLGEGFSVDIGGDLGFAIGGQGFKDEVESTTGHIIFATGIVEPNYRFSEHFSISLEVGIGAGISKWTETWGETHRESSLVLNRNLALLVNYHF